MQCPGTVALDRLYLIFGVLLCFVSRKLQGTICMSHMANTDVSMRMCHYLFLIIIHVKERVAMNVGLEV